MSDMPIAEVPTEIPVEVQPGNDGIVEVSAGVSTPAQVEAIGAIGVAPSVEKAEVPTSRSFIGRLLRRGTNLGTKKPALMGEDGSGPYKN